MLQFALALVNAGFVFELDANLKVLSKPDIVYGGISPTFVSIIIIACIACTGYIYVYSTIQ